MRGGAEFAEVFAEDKRSSSAVLDDGKVEQVTSGRDRGAGIRVVSGETTGFAHTADLTEAGLLAAAEAAAAAARSGGGGANGRRPHTARRAPGERRCETYPDDVPKATKVELLLRADEAARVGGRGHHPGVGRVRRQPQAHPGGQHRRPARRRRPGAHAVPHQRVATGDTGMQTGYESIGHTIGFELFDRYDVDELARARRPAGHHQAERPPGAQSGQMPVVIRPGSGGVLFHEACGHGLEADLVGKGASVFRGRVGEQVASPLRHARRRRHDGRRVGRHRHRRRGPPRPAQRAHPGRRAHRLHVGLPPGPQGGPRPVAATAAARATSTCRWCA